MPQWRNKGAPFSIDGTEIPTGGTFRAGEDHPDVIRRAHKLREVPVYTPPPPPPETTGDDGPAFEHVPEQATRFPGVDFGSDVAYEVARDAGLILEDFEDREGSGVDGAFLKSDVEEILDGH